jgi:hypothetical protein
VCPKRFSAYDGTGDPEVLVGRDAVKIDLYFLPFSSTAAAAVDDVDGGVVVVVVAAAVGWSSHHDWRYIQNSPIPPKHNVLMLMPALVLNLVLMYMLQVLCSCGEQICCQ